MPQTMPSRRPDRRLLAHLALAVAFKLLALALLWWLFVRDAGVGVDAERAAAHLAPAPSSEGAPR